MDAHTQVGENAGAQRWHIIPTAPSIPPLFPQLCASSRSSSVRCSWILALERNSRAFLPPSHHREKEEGGGGCGAASRQNRLAHGLQPTCEPKPGDRAPRTYSAPTGRQLMVMEQPVARRTPPNTPLKRSCDFCVKRKRPCDGQGRKCCRCDG